MLSPLLFALAFSPVIDTLRETGAGVCVDGVWAGAFLVMDDATLVAGSIDHLRKLAVALWGWCWRSRLEPYPGHPKTFVGALGPRSKRGAAACGGVFTFGMSALRAARRADGHDVLEEPVGDVVNVTIPIHDSIRVLGVRFHRKGRWSEFVEALAKKKARHVAVAYGVAEVLGVMRRKHLVVFYDVYARSVVEWSVAAWGLVSAKALYMISVVETQARHFALSGGSTGIYREGLAALLGGA